MTAENHINSILKRIDILLEIIQVTCIKFNIPYISSPDWLKVNYHRDKLIKDKIFSVESMNELNEIYKRRMK